MASLAHNTTNDTRLADLHKEVRALGRTAGDGTNSMPRLALRVTRAAVDGVIDLTRDPDTNEDAAIVLYRQYIEAFSSKQMFDHTKDGLKANASKLRTFVKMGTMTTIDPVSVIDRAVTIHGNIKPDDRLSCYPALIKVAQAQFKSGDAELTDDEIENLCRKGESDPKGQAAFLKSAAKALEKAADAPDADPAIAERIKSMIDEAGALIAYLGNREAEAAERAKLAELMAKYGKPAEHKGPTIDGEYTDTTDAPAPRLIAAE